MFISMLSINSMTIVISLLYKRNFLLQLFQIPTYRIKNIKLIYKIIDLN